IGAHGPEIQVAGSERRVDDAAGFPVDGGFGIVARGVGELLQNLAGVGGEINVIAGKNAPDITFAAIGRRGASIARFVGGGVDDVPAVAQEISASGAALAGGDQVSIGAIGV